jgi:hypothetical protein
LSVFDFDGLLWLLLLLGPLLLIQRRLHFETQAVFLILTRRSELATALFALLFFPGVFLHEGSHYLMARLLGVRTGRFSLIPRSLPEGRLQLGFVETESSDIVRDSLIGAAPLLAGGTFVAFAGLSKLGLSGLWEAYLAGGMLGFSLELARVQTQPDFWLWFYLTVAVSATMFPSASDRRAWLPLTLVIGAILLIVIVLGAGPWIIDRLGASINDAFRAIAITFAVSLGVQLVMLVPLLTVRLILSKLTRLQVISGE